MTGRYCQAHIPGANPDVLSSYLFGLTSLFSFFACTAVLPKTKDDLFHRCNSGLPGVAFAVLPQGLGHSDDLRDLRDLRDLCDLCDLRVESGWKNMHGGERG